MKELKRDQLGPSDASNPIIGRTAVINLTSNLGAGWYQCLGTNEIGSDLARTQVILVSPQRREAASDTDYLEREFVLVDQFIM